MKIHSEQLFNYLKSRGFELTEEDRANIVGANRRRSCKHCRDYSLWQKR
jgi:hypothetical protein